jgi:hypothetical protein
VSCRRHPRRVVIALTPAVALVAALTAGCGPAADARPAAGTPAKAPSMAVPTAQRTLSETGTDQIRPDAALPHADLRTPAPVRLQVPRVGIDTRLIDLGLQADRTIEVPASAAVAGWYRRGPAPGQVGPAVLVGHVDSRTGPGVFYRIRELQAGDLVNVRRADGRDVHFTVTEVSRFAKSGFPTAAVYGPTPFAELRLVTCGGTFDTAQRHYRDNVVVFARQSG